MVNKKQKIIIGNWKMNPLSVKKAEFIFQKIRKGLSFYLKKADPQGKIVICPPFVYLANFKKIKERTKNKKNILEIGAQDVFWEKEGAFTGEISSAMLKDLGCQYIIIGHSERRNYLQETNQMINRKLKHSLKEKLIPILCIGEKKEERKQGLTEKVLAKEIKSAFNGISKEEIKRVYVAYEPIWAIGSGKACNKEEIERVYFFLQKIFNKMYGFRLFQERIKFLYGGSISKENIKNYLDSQILDGFLVGGASLDPENFLSIIRETIFNF